MQLALSTTIAPPSIPVWDELSGNLRQGFTRKNQAWNPGPNVVNSTTAIGLRASLFLEGFGQSHSARYYNPLTGRFMSRDPEDGKITVPGSLHKYLYAGAEPVDWMDPTGRDDSSEDAELELHAPAKEVELQKTAEAEDDALCVADDELSLAAYWASLQGPAPVQSYPYNIMNKYGLGGELTGWTLYDEYGNRIYQYEIAPETRHGPGYHIYDQCGKIGFGNGPRGPHIPF
ncbi:MAG TPA: RHS repeat-associated core domain-containing protein [Terracidiphilus sp.]|jgi:RHS repeat-associated protein